MNIKKYFYMISVLVALIFAGCGTVEDNYGYVEIEFSYGDRIVVPIGYVGDLTSDVYIYDNGRYIQDNVIVSGYVNFNRPGRYTVTYTYRDPYGHTVYATRIIVVSNSCSYSDYYCVKDGNYIPYSSNPPHIDLRDPVEYIYVGGSYHLDYSAYDPEDGDITSRVYVDDSDVDVWTPGTYYIYLSVVDSDGNYALTEKKVVVMR